MPEAKFQIREILWATLPTRDPHGHEQEGNRPVVVVGVPSRVQNIPYDVIQVIPISKTAFTGVLFPTIAAGHGGLPLESTALVYQLMVLDTARIKGRLGKLSVKEFKPIQTGMKALLGDALEFK
jgi:mRNA interferase MazF